MPFERIVSGGQTGVDRAALDVALALDIPCGGWCPRGRRAEDGPIPARYPLRETEGTTYTERTRRNVALGDATMVLTLGRLDRGTRATIRHAESLGRPCLVVNLRDGPASEAAADWLRSRGIRTLNLAGPRESSAPGIHDAAFAYLDRLLEILCARHE